MSEPFIKPLFKEEQQPPPNQSVEESWKQSNIELDERQEKESQEKLKQLDEEWPLEQRNLDIAAMNAKKRLEEEVADLEKQKIKEADYGVITISDLYSKEYLPESYIIDKFLPATGFTMFSGDSGVGKSWLALEIIRAITCNDIFLDHFEIKTPNVAILLIDKENGARRLQKRLRSLGVPTSDKVYLLEYPEKFNLEDKGFMQSLHELIIQKGIGIVILDSFIDVLIGNENDSSDISSVFNSLRLISTNVCWVLLHHESKPMPKFQREAGDRARGSSNIKAQLDYLFSIQRTKSLKTIHIEQGKARDYEQMGKFAIEFISVEGTEEMGGFKYIGEVKEEVKMIEEAQEFIFEYLTEHIHASLEEIDSAGQIRSLTPRTLKDARSQMLKKGILDWTKYPNKGNTHYYFIVKGGEESDKEEN